MKTKLTYLLLALATVFACNNVNKEKGIPKNSVTKENTETRIDRTE